MPEPKKPADSDDAVVRHVTIDARTWLVAAFAVSITLLLWLVVSNALSVFLLMFTAILFAEAVRPLSNRLARRMPRGAAIVLVVIAILVAIVGISIVLLQPLGAELWKLTLGAPAYAAELQKKVLDIQLRIHRDANLSGIASVLANATQSVLGGLGQQLLGGPALLAHLVGDSLLIVLLAIAWLLGSGDLQKFVLSLIPAASAKQWASVFTEIGERLSAYVRAVLLNAAVVGVSTGAALALLGVPYALLLGFTAAVWQGIPMIGGVIAGAIIVLAALATSGWVKASIVAGIIALIQTIDGNVISPIIFGQRVQLSFLLIVFATVLGGTLLGLAGAFLAVPAAAALQVVIVRIVAPEMRRRNAERVVP